MLARKQSNTGDPILLAADYGPEEASNEGSEVIWTSRSVLVYYIYKQMLALTHIVISEPLQLLSCRL